MSRTNLLLPGKALAVLSAMMLSAGGLTGQTTGTGRASASEPWSTQDVPEARREILRLHAALIEAHLENRPDLWMSIEGDDYISANGGTVSFPTARERLDRRTAYLRDATFDVYTDLREPIVRVSEDGTLGWLIAEVEIAGDLARPDGTTEAFHDIWAWVELYERTDSGWKLIGNVSNRREP